MSDEADETRGQVVEGALLGVLERDRDPRSFVARLEVHVVEPPLHVDPAAWGAGFLSVHERDLSPELHEALKQCTPKALLRDLHRPVWVERWVERELIGGRDFGPTATDEVRAAMQRTALPPLERSVDVVAEEQARRRAFLAGPWQPALRDEEPRKDIVVPLEPSLSR